MEKINFELIIKISAIIIGVIGSIHQLKNFRLTSRSSIKTDLEILKMLEPENPNYKTLETAINNSLVNIYGSANKTKFKVYNHGDFIGGIIFIVLFGGWAIYLSRNGFSYWSILVGFFALAGIGGVLNGLDAKRAGKMPGVEY